MRKPKQETLSYLTMERSKLVASMTEREFNIHVASKPHSYRAIFEFESLNNLTDNHDLIIRKAYKGNTVVTLNREYYITTGVKYFSMILLSLLKQILNQLKILI